jgi:predicted secreted protein
VSDPDVPASLDLQVGEEKSIVLPGMGVSGYIWKDHIEGPPGVIQTSWQRGFAPGAPPAPVGMAAPETLHIKALSRGAVTLHLSKARPWERNVPPLQSHTIPVSVH